MRDPDRMRAEGDEDQVLTDWAFPASWCTRPFATLIMFCVLNRYGVTKISLESPQAAERGNKKQLRAEQMNVTAEVCITRIWDA